MLQNLNKALFWSIKCIISLFLVEIIFIMFSVGLRCILCIGKHRLTRASSGKGCLHNEKVDLGEKNMLWLIDKAKILLTKHIFF